MAFGYLRTMKTCGKCGEQQELTSFHRRGRIVQAWCRSCRQTYDRSYHARNSSTRVAQSRMRRAKLARFNAEMKAATPCADCGHFFHHAAMTWDHIPGVPKLADIANLVKGGMRRKFFIELTKCELVCANCHAVRTWSRQRGVAQPG
jgi:ribosomal protein L32